MNAQELELLRIINERAQASGLLAALIATYLAEKSK